uniref:chitin synthase n=1 Tax=Palpitomonas bilix TaxID=652834 RepID=A0A7S3D7P5_9EUKA
MFGLDRPELGESVCDQRPCSAENKKEEQNKKKIHLVAPEVEEREDTIRHVERRGSEEQGRLTHAGQEQQAGTNMQGGRDGHEMRRARSVPGGEEEEGQGEVVGQREGSNVERAPSFEGEPSEEVEVEGDGGAEEPHIEGEMLHKVDLQGNASGYIAKVYLKEDKDVTKLDPRQLISCMRGRIRNRMRENEGSTHQIPPYFSARRSLSVQGVETPNDNQKPELILVGIPMYNEGAGYLRCQLSSLANQFHELYSWDPTLQMEVIIVCDGMMSPTKQLQDSCIKLFDCVFPGLELMHTRLRQSEVEELAKGENDVDASKRRKDFQREHPDFWICRKAAPKLKSVREAQYEQEIRKKRQGRGYSNEVDDIEMGRGGRGEGKQTKKEKKAEKKKQKKKRHRGKLDHYVNAETLKPLDNSFEYPFHLSILIKWRNQMKSNSHVWLAEFFVKDSFESITSIPRAVLLTDCGILYDSGCIKNLYNEFSRDDSVMAVCARQRVMTMSEQEQLENIDDDYDPSARVYGVVAQLRLLFSPMKTLKSPWQALLRAVQSYDFDFGHAISKSAWNIVGWQPVLPGPCGMYSIKAFQMGDEGQKSVFDQYIDILLIKEREDAMSRVGLLYWHLLLAEDRIPSFLAVFGDMSKGMKTIWVRNAAFAYEAEVKLRQLVLQRKRWILGTLVGFLYLLNGREGRTFIFRKQLNCFRKFMLLIYMILQVVDLVLAYLGPGVSAMSLRMAMEELTRGQTIPLEWYWVEIISYGYLAWYVFFIFLHHRRPKTSPVIEWQWVITFIFNAAFTARFQLDTGVLLIWSPICIYILLFFNLISFNPHLTPYPFFLFYVHSWYPCFHFAYSMLNTSH